MARQFRIKFSGAVYHVTSLGDRREPIFEDNHDRLALLDVVSKLISPHISPAQMVVVPTHQVTLICPCLLLDRVIKNQHTLAAFNRPYRRFTAAHKSFDVYCCPDKNRVTLS